MKSFSNIRQLFFNGRTRNTFYNRLVFKTFSEVNKVKMIDLPEGESLDQILKDTTEPVMIDFYADWCPPCKKLTPVLVESFNTKQNFTLVKVNVDNHGDISANYGVSGIPHVVLVHNEKNVSHFVGFDQSGLSKMLDSIDEVSKL
jgi:thioredoxin 1